MQLIVYSVLNSMLLNRVELGESRVIYYRLRNIGPATAGSAGPVPAPLLPLRAPKMLSSSSKLRISLVIPFCLKGDTFMVIHISISKYCHLAN